MARTIGFVGTGLMGRGMARSLIRKGHAVQVYNRAIDNQMMARIKEGQSIKQVIAWAKDELVPVHSGFD